MERGGELVRAHGEVRCVFGGFAGQHFLKELVQDESALATALNRGGQTGVKRSYDPHRFFPLLGLMPAIIVDMQIEARCGQRRMAKVVAHETQIDLIVGHMRTGER
ncbi:hypothetical protein PPGU19_088660 (plasmid) [Paraburkholderia sp. PGU19]|nr:hypothetical protein PPGU19_088660 [Paraburkholderia sp. PGU19]